MLSLIYNVWCFSVLCRLSNSDPVEYSVYKPVLVLFSLVDGLQHLLKVLHDGITLWKCVRVWCDVWCGVCAGDIECSRS